MKGLGRRGFLTGLLAVPAIIRTPGLLMAVKPIAVLDYEDLFTQMANEVLGWNKNAWIEAMIHGQSARLITPGRVVFVPLTDIYLSE